MKVRLVRKHSERIDGVDLSGRSVGDTLDLPARDARLLLAEEWAAPERRRAEQESAINGRRSSDREPPGSSTDGNKAPR